MDQAKLAERQPWRVRLRGPHSIVGAGFLVDARHVLTCAHVVAAALGTPHPDLVSRPEGQVQVEFPAADLKPISATVAADGWVPIAVDQQGDIAVLTLDGDLSEDIAPAPLCRPPSLIGHSFRAYGYPRGLDDGVWAMGEVAGPGGPGGQWVQLEGVKTTGRRIERGFSGAAVWDDTAQGVVGMVVADHRLAEAKIAWMLPVDVLGLLWPPLAQHIRREGRTEGTSQVGLSTLLEMLPPDVSDFKGRDTELSQLKERLIAPASAHAQATATVISVVAGKPGVGKSALAIHLAHQLRQAGAFPDGQLYVNLRGAPNDDPRDPSSVIEDLLNVFGLRADLPQSLDARAAKFRAVLAGKRVLLILDNAASADQILPLIPGDPSCAVIVTSRDTSPLVPGSHLLRLDVLDKASSVELLASVADTKWTPRQLDAVQELAGLCGYLPLALRVSGAMMVETGLSPRRLAQQLADESRSRLDQLSPVLASFELSYERLAAEARAVFHSLGTLKADDFPAWVGAAAVGQTQAHGEAMVASLARAALLDVSSSQGSNNGGARFQFHDLIWDFAREQFRNQEEEAAAVGVLERVLSGYLFLARRANDRLEPGGMPKVRITASLRWVPDDPATVESAVSAPIKWFKAERKNLVAAVEQGFEAGLYELTWQLAAALPVYFDLHARWIDWRRTNELGLEAARRAQDPLGEALALHTLGIVCRYQSDWEPAHSCHEQAVRLFEQLGERHWHAIALSTYTRLHLEQENWDEAIAGYKRCLPLFREVGNRRLEAWSLLNLGRAFQHLGLPDDAIDYCEQAVDVFTELDDQLWQARSLLSLGEAYAEQAVSSKAIVCFERALGILQGLGDGLRMAHALRGIGLSHLQQRNWNDAIEHLSRAQDLFHRYGDRSREARTFIDLGLAYQQQRRWDEAEISLRDACRMLDELDLTSSAARTRFFLGELSYEREQLAEAIGHYREALATFRVLGDSVWIVRTLLKIGLLSSSMGQQEAGRDAWAEALDSALHLDATQLRELHRILGKPVIEMLIQS